MKRFLIVVLALALLIEASLAFMCFFLPKTSFHFLDLPFNETYSLLGYIIAWFLALVSVLVGYSIYCLLRNRDCRFLLNLIGFWWIFLGIGIYFKFGRLDNLFLDSAKGLLIVLLNNSYHKKHLRKCLILHQYLGSSFILIFIFN